MTTASKKDRGLYGKFYIDRVDGQSADGKKHDGCEYFVLDLTHDPFALPAILAYADACREEYPLLARDLKQQANLIRIRDVPDLGNPGRGAA